MFNPSSQLAEAGGSPEFEANLVYTWNSGQPGQIVRHVFLSAPSKKGNLTHESHRVLGQVLRHSS